MATFQPVPTYADPVVVDEKTGKSSFNPVWLSWFLTLSNGGLPSNLNNVTGTLGILNGGTGAQTLTNHGVLLGHGNAAISASTAGVAGQVFTSGGPTADGAYADPAAPVLGTADTQILFDNAGAIAGSANFTFDTATSTFTLNGPTSFTGKYGVFGKTPIVQPTTAVAAATYVAGVAVSTFHTDDTYDGYTLAQVVKALRNLGVLA
jgi:hypothetical protein